MRFAPGLVDVDIALGDAGGAVGGWFGRGGLICRLGQNGWLARIGRLGWFGRHGCVELVGGRFLLEERRSRIPVYDRSLDDIVGYVSAKDIVSLAWDGGPVVLSDLLRNVKFFPDTVSAIEVLRYMQRESQRIVIALDEHGVVSGMVTFEDLFEELVGDILGEHEENVPPLTREPDGSVVARGDTPIRDINRELDIALEEPEGVTTIAGLSAALAGGGIPNRNARLAAGDGSVLVVLEASPRVVKRVRIIPARHVTNHPAPA